jgi:hypothetical protein
MTTNATENRLDTVVRGDALAIIGIDLRRIQALLDAARRDNLNAEDKRIQDAMDACHDDR